MRRRHKPRRTQILGALGLAWTLVVAGMLMSSAPAVADTAFDDSPVFTLSTIDGTLGALAQADSPSFVLDTRPFWPPFLSGPFADSGVFTLDTRGTIIAGLVVRASQRPGTTLADVFYDLSGADSSYSVSVAVSSDGGATFTIPATHFAGDGVTSPVAPGTGRHIVWDAGADLGSGYFPNMVVRLFAGGSSAASGVFTVNLRGLSGGLAVSGTVLDGVTGKPLAGASVQLGTASAQTDALGRFQFASVAVGSYPLTASLAGYVTANDTVSVTPGSAPVRVLA